MVASVGAISPTNFGGATVNCPTGYQAIAGGVDPENVFTEVVTSSAPFADGLRTLSLSDGQHSAATGWQGFIRDNDTTPKTGKVSVVCAPIG